MGSFVAESGTDVSMGGEKVKNGENNHAMEIKGGTEDEPGSKSLPMYTQLEGRSPIELPSLRSAEGQKVDENLDPLKDWDYKPGELDYVQKYNGNPDSQMHENGDGDLPSFSIKRLRRLPLRVTSDQQSSTLDSRAEPTGIAADRNQPDDDRGEEIVAVENVMDSPLGNRSEAGSPSAPLVQADEGVEQRQALPDPSAVDAHPSCDSVGPPQQEQRFPDLTRSKDDVVVPLERSPHVLEEGTNPFASSGVQNGEIGNKELELQNGKHTIEEHEFRHPGSGGLAIADKSLGFDLSFGRMIEEFPPDREKQSGVVSGQEISEENKDVVASREHELDNLNTLKGESGNSLTQSHESYIPSPIPEVEHPAMEHSALDHSSAFGFQVDNLFWENVSPGISDSPSSSAELGNVSGKENTKIESSVPVAADPNRGILLIHFHARCFYRESFLFRSGGRLWSYK